MDGKRKAQLIENIEYIVFSYDNQINDRPEEYSLISEEELLDMVYSQIFDMRVENYGESCIYKEGICDDLKFYGKENIEKLILEIGKIILK